ncbi:hypothetical protein [Microcoleus sp. herbarium14]|uniref:hypothetical protein n=1 Tax=Microcoleus sp. herbarium14 TaxID=3055439 RepID=UPI002FD08F38
MSYSRAGYGNAVSLPVYRTLQKPFPYPYTGHDTPKAVSQIQDTAVPFPYPYTVGCFVVDWAREPASKKILQTVQNVRSNPNENSLFSKKRSPFSEQAIALCQQ